MHLIDLVGIAGAPPGRTPSKARVYIGLLCVEAVAAHWVLPVESHSAQPKYLAPAGSGPRCSNGSAQPLSKSVAWAIRSDQAAAEDELILTVMVVPATGNNTDCLCGAHQHAPA